MEMNKEYMGKRLPKENEWGRAWSNPGLTSGGFPSASSASGGPSVDVGRTGGPPVRDVGAVEVEFVRETVVVPDEPSKPSLDLTGDDAPPPGVAVPEQRVRTETVGGDGGFLLWKCSRMAWWLG